MLKIGFTPEDWNPADWNPADIFGILIVQDQALRLVGGILLLDLAIGPALDGPVVTRRFWILTRVTKGGAGMIKKPELAEVQLVPCDVCRKEIPKSVALSAEDQDYVLYFCGLDCYEEWSADQIRQRTQEAGEP